MKDHGGSHNCLTPSLYGNLPSVFAQPHKPGLPRGSAPALVGLLLSPHLTDPSEPRRFPQPAPAPSARSRPSLRASPVPSARSRCLSAPVHSARSRPALSRPGSRSPPRFPELLPTVPQLQFQLPQLALARPPAAPVPSTRVPLARPGSLSPPRPLSSRPSVEAVPRAVTPRPAPRRRPGSRGLDRKSVV